MKVLNQKGGGEESFPKVDMTTGLKLSNPRYETHISLRKPGPNVRTSSPTNPEASPVYPSLLF